MKQMRQEFEERLDIANGDDEDGDIRRRLLTDDEAAKSLLEKVSVEGPLRPNLFIYNCIQESNIILNSTKCWKYGSILL